MTTFELKLQSHTQSETITNIVSFMGEDKSGQFGILAHHSRMMTCLVYGLAQFRYDNDEVEFLAVPGGVLYAVNNCVSLSTRHYFRNKDCKALVATMDKEFYVQEQKMHNIQKSLNELDKSLLKYLWDLKRQQG